MKKRVAFQVVALVAAFVCCVVVNSAYALKVNIDPPRVELTVKPGEEKNGFVTVQNYDETGTVHMKAYVQDLVYLPDGSNDFLPPGSTPWSMGDNIKIGPTEFDIGPGKQEMVRYSISLPPDAKGGRYCVIFFEVTVPPAQFQQVGANVNVRLGSVLLVTVENTDILKAKLKAITVAKPKDAKPLTISCTVHNEGNILARPSGTATIIDVSKVKVVEIPINKEKGGVLPDTNRVYTAEYKDAPLKKGTYYAQIVLDYGGTTMLGGQTKFEID